MKKIICPSCYEEYNMDECNNEFYFEKEPLFIEQQQLQTELQELGYYLKKCSICGQLIICKTLED